MLKLRAFTLIEILVVATIMIVLTAIGVASFSAANKSARDAKRKSDLETIRQAAVLYRTQHATNLYPANLAALVSGGQLTPPAPIDPDGSSYGQHSTDADSFSMTTAGFCICDRMETDKGNKTTGASCALTDTDWVSNSGAFYCVRNPN